MFKLTSGYIIKKARDYTGSNALTTVEGKNQLSGQMDVLEIHGECQDQIHGRMFARPDCPGRQRYREHAASRRYAVGDSLGPRRLFVGKTVESGEAVEIEDRFEAGFSGAGG